MTNLGVASLRSFETSKKCLGKDVQGRETPLGSRKVGAPEMAGRTDSRMGDGMQESRTRRD